jgi:hypothetical protein
MEKRFDELAKLLAGDMPRREALTRLGGLFVGAIAALPRPWGSRAGPGGGAPWPTAFRRVVEGQRGGRGPRATRRVSRGF